MDQVKQGTDALFILLGAIMVLAMHAGFAFLELGTVRKKNQVNALVKILADFAISTIAYFFVGYYVAYGVTFYVGAPMLEAHSGFAASCSPFVSLCLRAKPFFLPSSALLRLCARSPA